jgi:deoxyribodipyrimidine photolyase
MDQYHDIQKICIQQLNGSDICVEADYVLYWMQQSQLMECNHSLEYSVQQANELGMGVVVVFELIPYFVISSHWT